MEANESGDTTNGGKSTTKLEAQQQRPNEGQGALPDEPALWPAGASGGPCWNEEKQQTGHTEQQAANTVAATTPGEVWGGSASLYSALLPAPLYDKQHGLTTARRARQTSDPTGAGKIQIGDAAIRAERR